MNAEWVTAVGTIGTFAVILASAIAALLQLRHMRGSNQIVALTECRETLESPAFREAQHFVSYELPKRLEDPQEARKAAVLPFQGEYQALGTIANFFESMGVFVKHRIIDREIGCDLWAFVVMRNWEALLPVTTFVRRELDTESLWENFEYLANTSQRWIENNPSAYPRTTPHMPKDYSLCELVDAETARGQG